MTGVQTCALPISLNFQNNFSLLCARTAHETVGSVQYFSMIGVLFSRWVFIHLSLHESMAVIGMPSPEIKKKRNLLYVSNNKFLGKWWYGRHPWIRLAKNCERMVEKGINFIFCLGTSYDISSMESIVNYFVVFVDRKGMPLKIFFSLNLKLWALAPLQIPTSLCNGPIYLLYSIFIFLWVSIFSYKHQLGGTMIVLEHWA